LPDRSTVGWRDFGNHRHHPYGTRTGTNVSRWNIRERTMVVSFCEEHDARNWKGDNYLGKDPASTRIRHKPVDPVAHSTFSAAIRDIAPEKR